MIKRILFFIIILFSLQSYSQNLVYKHNGNIRDAENNKIPPNKVRALFANNENLLANYNSGRSKKTAGNILLIGGLGFLATDLIIGANADVKFPSALTYIGLAAVVISIPVKIGFSRKIKNVVSDYNNQKAIGFKQFQHEKMELITNSNGLGLRLTLN